MYSLDVSRYEIKHWKYNKPWKKRTEIKSYINILYCLNSECFIYIPHWLDAKHWERSSKKTVFDWCKGGWAKIYDRNNNTMKTQNLKRYSDRNNAQNRIRKPCVYVTRTEDRLANLTLETKITKGSYIHAYTQIIHHPKSHM